LVRIARLTALMHAEPQRDVDHLAARFGISRRTIFRDMRIPPRAGMERVFVSKARGYRMAVFLSEERRHCGPAREELTCQA
jgi:predicted DNA-binding transcriptional regulator YafY